MAKETLDEAPRRRRRRLPWILVGSLLFVATMAWAAWPPHQESLTVGEPRSRTFDGCRTRDRVEWSSGFGLEAPPPPYVLPRVHVRLHDLTGDASGTLKLAFEVAVNGQSVHQSFQEIRYRAGKTVDWSGEAPESFDAMEAWMHGAGRNDVLLSVDLSCFPESGRGFGFRLELGPMDVVTQQERGWFEW